MKSPRFDPRWITEVEIIVIKVVALLCLLHTLYQVVKHEFGL
ncbi:MAG: hypothetical protein ABSH49_27415 [Bryobacteraceae bacterium]